MHFIRQAITHQTIATKGPFQFTHQNSKLAHKQPLTANGKKHYYEEHMQHKLLTSQCYKSSPWLTLYTGKYNKKSISSTPTSFLQTQILCLQLREVCWCRYHQTTKQETNTMISSNHQQHNVSTAPKKTLGFDQAPTRVYRKRKERHTYKPKRTNTYRLKQKVCNFTSI